MIRKAGSSSLLQCLQGIVRRPRSLQNYAPSSSERTALVSAEGAAKAGTEQQPGIGSDHVRLRPSALSGIDESSYQGVSGLARENSGDFSDGAGNPSGHSDRHLAYLERKKARRAGRKRGSLSGSPTSPCSPSTLDTHGFLSHLPEVNADIAYRFSFTVVASSGQAAQQIIEAVCNTEMAEGMNLPTPSSSSVNAHAEEAFRCLCPVPFDNTRHPHTPSPQSPGVKRLDPTKFSSDVPKLAKLIFSPVSFGDPLPKFRNRFEALSSALVCVLIVDPKDGEPSFHEQLLEYERLVDTLLFHRKPLRPARAMLLASHSGPSSQLVEPPAGHMRWTERLSEYEMCVEENLWKFGPVDLSDAQDILAVFGTIASERIMRSQGSIGEDSDGSQQSDPPPLYEAECDAEWLTGTIEEEPEYWMAQLAADVGQDRLDDDEPKASSGFKHGWLNAMQRGAA
mmetsp:Transcript_61225/g.112238  ORF Transcript_61225/g.112238 Transcript_61225/m.112238 type:complete len:453 (-) Transcript_61225:161-1519(-)